jgi:predicted RNA-binding protein with PUA-like domain
MPALVAGIHVLVSRRRKKNVDGRNKSGHDGWVVNVMNYWLVKSEPSAWSWDQQVAKGAKGEAWTGVRNFTARQNLVKMKKGDLAFYYHSNEGKEIVGIAEIIKEAYPDPTDKTGKFVCVDIKADKPLKTPVTMAAIKADKRLTEMALVKYSRLSVQPVTAEEWKIVCKMGGM